MGRDGAIVVDDREDDQIDEDELETDDDDSDESDEDEERDPAALLAELNALRESNAKLEAANRRNNTENARRRKVAAAMKKHGIEDLDAWAEAQKAQQPASAPPPAAPEGIVEGSGSPTEPPEAPTTDVKPPAGLDEAEVARRVALEREKWVAQDGERVSLLEDELRASRIETLLKDAGFSGTLEKALRVMDLDTIEVDGEAKVTGVEEAVESLKKEIPEWFKTRQPAGPPRARDSRTLDGGDKPRPPQRAQSWDQRVADQLRR